MPVPHTQHPAKAVEIKGTPDGLVVTVDETLGADWLRALTAELMSAPDFWRGGRVALAVGARELGREPLVEALHLLERYGMRLWAVLSANGQTELAARELSLAVQLPSRGRPPRERLVTAEARVHPLGARASEASVGPPAHLRESLEPQLSLHLHEVAEPRMAEAGTEEAEDEEPLAEDEEPPAEDEEPLGHVALVLRETLRSGRAVRHGGPVIVIGDVNPGAELIAGGDVVVWGKLRGLVHAGAAGNPEAVVCALDLNPTQLRIADKITVPPKGARRQPVPEMALIRGGLIVAEPWRSKA
jgi:septum site-determining protein MinC